MMKRLGSRAGIEKRVHFHGLHLMALDLARRNNDWDEIWTLSVQSCQAAPQAFTAKK